jgi:hypothetical protein
MADVPPPEQTPASAHVTRNEEGPARDETRQEPERAGVDRDTEYRPPTTYDLLRTYLYGSNAEGFETEFAGGTVEISAEAMARSLAPADASDRVAPSAPDKTTQPRDDSRDAQAVPSPNPSDLTTDLGERVL